MTNTELIDQHKESTKFCSFSSHMVRVSTTYKEIIDMGYEIVPDILQYLSNEDAGMSVMLLLSDITNESPYKPESKYGFDVYNVSEAKKAWINWGKEKNLI